MPARLERNDTRRLRLESVAGRTLQELRQMLKARYGELLSTEEAAAALKMTVSAFRMARSRGTLALDPLAVPGRRGQLYAPSDVAWVLLEWLGQGTDPGPNPCSESSDISG